MPAKKTIKFESRFDRIDKTLKAIVSKLLEYDSLLRSQQSSIQTIEEKINHLPTKEEFYKMESDLMGEVKAEREENVVIQSQLSRHDDQIAIIESKLAI